MNLGLFKPTALLALVMSIGSTLGHAHLREHQLGSYRVTIDEKKVSGYDDLSISVTRSTPEKSEEKIPFYRAWFHSRSTLPGDRMGAREYWMQDDPKQKITLNPDSLQIHLSANPNATKTAKEWTKLFQLPTPEVYYLILPTVDHFAQKNRIWLKALNHKTDGEILNFEIELAIHRGKGMSSLEKKFVEAVETNSYEGPIEKARYLTQVPNEPLLFVTHASSVFDRSQKAKTEIDSLVKEFKEKSLSTIYLMHDDEMKDFSWYLAERKATYTLFSFGGEHSFLITNPNVVLTGGFFSQCFRRTLQDTITRYQLSNNSEPLHLRLPMKAIYTSTDELLFDVFKKTKTQKEFVKYIDESLFWNVIDVSQDDSLDGDTDAIGELNLALYTFEIYIDGDLATIHGSGLKHVVIHFEK